MARLVSVVIPSYNGAAFIGEAIRSVFRQSYRPVELIVVDDGSTDGSPEVIREVCRQPPLDGFRFIEQENRGAPAAIMRGLEAARGDLLTMLNGDDAYHPDRLAELVPHLAAPCAMAFSGVGFIDETGSPLPPSHGWPAWYANALRETEHCPTPGYALLLHNVSVTSGNFVFTRELYESLGGFSDHRFVHDWDFLMRTVYHAEPVWLRRRLISYRIHGSNTTESVRDRLFEEASDALRRYLELCAGERPPNPLAPCAANWPRFFPEFIARHRPFFAPERLLSSFVS
jgi:glycosyltransferase involved in cell wall biosynthesis